MQNRVAIITGASSGIGEATALRLADSSRLVLVARRRDKLDALVRRIEEQGGSAIAVGTDLSSLSGPVEAVAAAVQTYGGIDVVVNNAGVFRPGTDADPADGDLDAQLSLNLLAPIRLVRAAVPYLKARGGGWIVNVSSIAAELTFTGCGVYSATKAGLEAWSRSLREELRADRIRVVVIAPGATDTEIWPPGDDGDRNRMCRSDDVARTIAFCLALSPQAVIERVVVAPPGGTM